MKTLKDKIEHHARNYTKNVTGKEVEEITTEKVFQPVKQLEFLVDHIMSDVKLESSPHTEDDTLIIPFKRKKYGYMIATTALHLTGDISADEPSLCSIYGETRDDEYGYYVGMWILGYGYFNVLFPKRTTRPLTDEEVDYWSNSKVAIGHQPAYGFNREDLMKSREIVKGN